MAFEVKGTACCGVHELNNISQCKDPEEVIKGFMTWYDPFAKGGKEFRRIPFVNFTGVTTRHGRDHVNDRKDNYGQELHDYIVANRLGTVMRSEEQLNKQTSAAWVSNGIRIWVWTPDWAALDNWRKQHATP